MIKCRQMEFSPDADPDWDTLDTLGPKVFVEAGVDTDVLRTHLLLSEITDRLIKSNKTACDVNLSIKRA